MDEEARLRSLIDDYLKEAKMMHLATVRDGKPWSCNVWFAADKDMNIYWFSSRGRRHSKEVEDSPHVAASIWIPSKPSDESRGIQLEGTAERLTKPGDIAKALSVYAGKIFTLQAIKQYMADRDYPHHFYRIRPSSIVLFDTKNYPENSRREYKPEDTK